MTASVAIGEFSRLTHLTIKSLRHYHEHGLLVPYAVDEASGYRRYSIDQVPDALLIGRLRALDMPLAEVRRVVDTTSPQERDAAIADHLFRMERELGRTREIVASLRDLLRPPVAPEITRRSLDDLVAVTATDHVGRDEIGAWCAETFTELYSDLDQQRRNAQRARGCLLQRRVLHRGERRGDRVRPGRPERPFDEGSPEPVKGSGHMTVAGGDVRRRRARGALRRLRPDLRGARLPRRGPRDRGTRTDPGDLSGQPTRYNRRVQLPHRGVLARLELSQGGRPLEPPRARAPTHGSAQTQAKGHHANHQPRPDRDRQRQRRRTGHLLQPASRPAAGRRRQPVLRRRPRQLPTAVVRL